MDAEEKAEEHKDEQAGLVWRLGPLEIDVPRTLGYYGGIVAAVAFDLIVPELALFIAAVPLVKLLKRKHAGPVARAASNIFEGAAKPVGGDTDASIRLADDAA